MDLSKRFKLITVAIFCILLFVININHPNIAALISFIALLGLFKAASAHVDTQKKQKKERRKKVMTRVERLKEEAYERCIAWDDGTLAKGT